MEMQIVYQKEHEVVVHNSVAQLSSVTSAPWWRVPLNLNQFHGGVLWPNKLNTFHYGEL